MKQKQHVWNCSVRGDKKSRSGNTPEALENMYVVAPDVLTAARKAVKEAGLMRTDYVQAHRVTKLRGLIQ